MKQIITPAEYQAITRNDLSTFIHRSYLELNPKAAFLPNWHIDLIASKLAGCLRGEITRLIINVPPRSLKSHSATVAFPAFLLGHRPTSQIICASYGQDLANKHSMDCRTLMASAWYKTLFPTRLSPQKQSVQEFLTTQNGFRMATSVGGVLTGRGAGFIIIDDPLKPDEALSETQRTAVNHWFDHTLYSRMNDKRTGCILVIMQRLHEDDLVGHIVEREEWEVVRIPGIAEEDETHVIDSFDGRRTVSRRAGEALHPEREPIAELERLRRRLGEYHFAGQYQQQPAPLGGGMVKAEWFKYYVPGEQPAKFDLIFQSWDTANKSTELSDFSVCTTWGKKKKRLFLLHVLRKRLDYPNLKRAVREQAALFHAATILIEDKASGTQLIQELIHDGAYGVTQYTPTMDKIMRLHSVTSTIENRFVYLPTEADWLADYLRELTSFPKAKHDDQTDSTSQALDWVKQGTLNFALFDYYDQKELRTTYGLPDEFGFEQWDADEEIIIIHRPTGKRFVLQGSEWIELNTESNMYPRGQFVTTANEASLVTPERNEPGMCYSPARLSDPTRPGCPRCAATCIAKLMGGTQRICNMCAYQWDARTMQATPSPPWQA